MKNLYLQDERPWIIGYSGGKDSTCVVQMTYNMLLDLKKKQRKKTVHIISSNTLVENPYIDKRIHKTLTMIKSAAKKQDVPIVVKRVKPELNETFWINLIGRGYPSPNRWFRWCTDRLKIRPASKYILEQVKENGEVIILLGARKDESGSRAQTMGKFAIKNFKLRRHVNIQGAYVYTPIENLDFNEVWAYLLATKITPWGEKNNDLRFLYKKIDQECPLVMDVKTPSCGGSRFGCWTCTVVDKDKSITALIDDGEEWLKPLLEYRDWIHKIRNDKSMRQNTRKNDRKKKMHAEKMGREFITPEHRGHKILGPFTFKARHEMLQTLIETQKKVKDHGLILITPEEIKAIETLWIYEGDNISSISDEISLSEFDYINENQDVNGIIGDKRDYLIEICEEKKIPIELIERLLHVENDLSSLSKRKGIYNRLEKVIDESILIEYISENGVS